VDVLDRAVRHQQSILVIELLAVARRLLDDHLHGGAIFGVGALNN